MTDLELLELFVDATIADGVPSETARRMREQLRFVVGNERTAARLLDSFREDPAARALIERLRRSRGRE